MFGGGGAVASNGDHHRAYSARYGARDPLLAPWPRLVLYLFWRAFMTALRPAVLLALLAAALVLAISALRQAPAPVRPAGSPGERIEQAFLAAAPGRADRRAIWLDGLDRALEPRPRAAPDLPLAQSYAAAAILIEGREALAVQRLQDGRSPRAVEAQLRGLPALGRAQLLEAAIIELEADGRDAGLEPPALILAPSDLRVRLERAERLYGPALEDAALWFFDPGGRALALASLPGSEAEAPILYGDVRDVLVQGCALAGAMGRSIGQCRVGFLPKPEADPVLAGLSLAVLGAGERARPGARLVKAAYGAGHLSPSVAETLAFGADPALGREALLASIMPILAEAGEAWTQPVRYEEALLSAARESAAAARIDDGARLERVRAVAAVARDSAPLAALRLTAALGRADEAERLALLAEGAGPKLLALQDMSPDAIPALLEAEADDQRRGLAHWPQQALLQAGAALALVLAAISLVLMTLAGGYFRARGRGPGALERLDGAVSRLILGKNF